MGIDLGTTNSLVARVGDDGRPQVLSGPHGRLVPSVIAFDEVGQFAHVGVSLQKLFPSGEVLAQTLQRAVVGLRPASAPMLGAAR